MIKVAMLWLVNEDGELLLARRDDHKKQDPGLWGPSVTGKVEPGEAYEQALVREADEELALKPGSYNYSFLFETKFDHPDGEPRYFKVYVATVDKSIVSTLQIDTNEVAEIAWMHVNEVKRLLNSDDGKMVVASAHTLWEKIFKSLDRM